MHVASLICSLSHVLSLSCMFILSQVLPSLSVYCFQRLYLTFPLSHVVPASLTEFFALLIALFLLLGRLLMLFLPPPLLLFSLTLSLSLFQTYISSILLSFSPSHSFFSCVSHGLPLSPALPLCHVACLFLSVTYFALVSLTCGLPLSCTFSLCSLSLSLMCFPSQVLVFRLTHFPRPFPLSVVPSASVWCTLCLSLLTASFSHAFFLSRAFPLT